MQQLSESTRAERIARLTMMLMCGERVTVSAYAPKFDISERQLRRDLNEMSRAVSITRTDEGFWMWLTAESEQISPF